MVRRLRAALAALAGAALLAPASASAMPDTTSGVHLWSFGGAGIDTRAEAVELARRNDVIVGGPRFLNWIGAMHAAHPGVLVIQYHSGIAVGGAEFRAIERDHPDWLLRDAEGNLLQNRFFKYLLDPRHPGVRDFQARWAVAQQAGGWDGVYMDALGLFGIQGFGARPVDPLTGRPFTATAWIEATAGLAAAVRASVSIPVIINGLRDGPTYFGVDQSTGERFVGAQVLADVSDGGVSEGCFRAAHDPLDDWPTLWEWKQQVAALVDAQARGSSALCLTKTWEPGGAALVRQWHDFTLASFLLATGPRAYYLFWGRQGDGALTDHGERALRIGAPLGDRFLVGRARARRFASGIAVANPTAAAVSVALGGRYVLPSGRVGTRLALAPHAGAVLLKAP